MQTSSKRTLWKGAITFGLVHIPVALHSATADQGLDFDWLDKRSMDPVGYKRINKRTGEEMAPENIARGIAYEKGQYVILSPEELQAAYPRTTQTIEIEAFVAATDIACLYLERPYYVSPVDGGQKVYALLRETLKKTGKVAIARVVIQGKQHLAMLTPLEQTLVLALLRWGNEVRPPEGLDLPPQDLEAAGIKQKEMAMAEQLVNDMTSRWRPQDFTDSFKEKILQLVAAKVMAGDTESVRPPEAEEAPEDSADIYDLTEILKRSLHQGRSQPVPGATRPDADAGPGRSAQPRSSKRAQNNAASKPSTPRKKAA